MNGPPFLIDTRAGLRRFLWAGMVLGFAFGFVTGVWAGILLYQFAVGP